MLQFVVRIGTEVEARFNSVERLLEYTEVKAAVSRTARLMVPDVSPVIATATLTGLCLERVPPPYPCILFLVYRVVIARLPDT